MLFRLSLKAQIITLSFVLLLISLAVGTSSFYFLNAVTANYDEIIDSDSPKQKLAYEMMLSYRQIRISLRTLGLNNLSPTESEKAIKETIEAITAFEDYESQYKELGFDEGQEELYNQFHASWMNFKSLGAEALEMYKRGSSEDKAKLENIFLVICPQKASSFSEAAYKLLEFHNHAIEKNNKQAMLAAKDSNYSVLTIIVLGFISGLTAAIFFARKVTSTINHLTAELSSGSEQVNQASSQIAITSQNVSQAASTQASSLEETVATMEEISSMVKISSENGKQAAQLAATTRDIAVKGETEIKKLIDSIYSISADSKKIEEITSVIDDIAFQTNLLALNAAVEAARAGEQGKGFAVVAEAVRSLAQRSSGAAKDIADLIKHSVAKIESSSQQAAQGGAVLTEIVNSVKKVSDLNNEIANATTEQSNGIAQVSRAMNQLDQITQQNAAASEEAAAAAEELSSQSSLLKRNIESLEDVVQGKSAA